MSRRFNLKLSLLAALALASGPDPIGANEIYRWVDAQGRIQFGDKPPPEGAERLESAPDSPSDPQLQRQRDRGQRLLEVMTEDRQRRGEENRAEDQAEADRLARCERARRRSSQATTANYIYQPTSDPNNPRILSDGERREFEQQLQAELRRYCGTGDVPE